MDDRRFDDLTRLAATASRRRLLKALVATAGGGLLALRGRGRIEAGDDNAPCAAGEAGCPGCCAPFQGRITCFIPTAAACGSKGVNCTRCPLGESCVQGVCAPCERASCPGSSCCHSYLGCQPGTARLVCGSGGTCVACPDYWRCQDQICTRCDLDCEGGCCTEEGECIPFARQTNDACGTGGAACRPCEELMTCLDGVCILLILGAPCEQEGCPVGCCDTIRGGCVEEPTNAACGRDGENCDECEEGEECVEGRCTKKIGLGPLDPSRPDFAFAAVRPEDFSDPFVADDLGLVVGIEYTGLDGGVAAGAMNERLHDAIQPVAEVVTHGFVGILGLRDAEGRTPAGVPVSQRTDLFQTGDNEEAERLLEAIFQDYFALGTTPIDSPGGKGFFVAWRGGTEEAPLDNLAAIFRHTAFVGALQIGIPAGAVAQEDTANALEELRQSVVRRLDRQAEPDFNGLAGIIPSLEWLNRTSGGGLPNAPAWRRRIYTHVDGRLNPQSWMNDERLREIIKDHEDVEAAVQQSESVPVEGGTGQIGVQVNALRFAGEAQAAALQEQFPAQTRRDDERDEGYAAEQLAAVPALPAILAPLWFLNFFTDESRGTLPGVRVWVRYGLDLFGLLVVGPTQVEPGTIDPTYLDGLTGLAQRGVEGFVLAHGLAGAATDPPALPDYTGPDDWGGWTKGIREECAVMRFLEDLVDE